MECRGIRRVLTLYRLAQVQPLPNDFRDDVATGEPNHSRRIRPHHPLRLRMPSLLVGLVSPCSSLGWSMLPQCVRSAYAPLD